MTTLPLLFFTGLLAAADPQSLFDLSARTLEGQPAPLSAYKGKVVLVVNTASFCGFTRQYEGLEKLHEQNSARGFAVLAFPSNDFGEQEPGSADEIRKFCTNKYAVKFPLFEKVATQGSKVHPVYAFVSKTHGAPQWNFHKYLVGKDGKVIAAFPSSVAPDSPELKAALDKALK